MSLWLTVPCLASVQYQCLTFHGAIVAEKSRQAVAVLRKGRQPHRYGRSCRSPVPGDHVELARAGRREGGANCLETDRRCVDRKQNGAALDVLLNLFGADGRHT